MKICGSSSPHGSSSCSNGCRCSGYRGIPVHLLLGPVIGPSLAQGKDDDPSYGEDPHEGGLVRRTTTKTAKDQKTSSRAPAGEERKHAHVSSARLRAEEEDNGQKTAYRPRYPRQGGDQLSLCLPKAAQWLLAAPLKIAWTVQGARGRRQLPPPTPMDRRHYPTKTTSTEE
jgi:hypothetical protein